MSTTHTELDALADGLKALAAPKLNPDVAANDFDAVADHVKRVAALCDTYLAAVGKMIKSHAHRNVDPDYFQGQFTDALDYTLHEIALCGEAANEPRIPDWRYEKARAYRANQL